MDAVPANGTAGEDIQEIKRAADRARALTAQLLAFGRKQVTEPRLLDLNELVANMDRMLRRLIGGDIDLLTLPDTNIGVVRIDPAQFEQVLVNLVVNARDAMPSGGSVVIATARATVEDGDVELGGVPPGDWVRVTVRDTGTGIPPHVIEHVFEPFFTTKEIGKGTGLGLSTCYGIIQHAGGHIQLATSVGNGTTFSVYLPRVDGARAARAKPPSATGSLPGGTETILLVEDEPQVRKLAARVLRSAGYTVLEASDGNAALALVEGERPKPDLLVTDLVMPGMSGGDLWEKLHARDETLRVLLISGYTADEAVHRDISLERLPFLAKPFTVGALAAKVRAVLDAPRDQPSGPSGNGGPEAR
jgi:CheY-like chemotaxis protein